ncbi:hypothetical protein [Pseudomonas donghuensis]|uniref:hypothetical protein n=1 Tax=Pseudomonas donghuensis TaxID=1163398 RepID=UPI00215EDAE0|nr:hypothetical protein [Pseudomonas donghuensis]UVL23721.1 hypothetical protein LOY30_23375 [Pseudomonas donghuensis]
MEIRQLKKEGLFTITTSFVLIVIALILSSGYYPAGGLLWSLNHEMYVFKVEVGCEAPLTWAQRSSCEDGFAMTVQTKYVISTLALLLVYGVGQYLEFFPSLRFWSKSSQAE